MKKHLMILRMVILACTMECVTGYCGIVKLTSGSLDFLKHDKQINLEYVYDGMTVRGKDKKESQEEDFVAQKVAEYNQKKAGRGDEWREGWIDDRVESYQPRFNELLNKTASGKNIDLQFDSFKDAKYTLILKTTYTEIGWKFSDVIKHPFFINAQAIFVESQNRTNVLAVISITKAPGNGDGTDFATRQGLAEAYAKAGKELGIFIYKTLK
jgi:hypothetical protein